MPSERSGSSSSDVAAILLLHDVAALGGQNKAQRNSEDSLRAWPRHPRPGRIWERFSAVPEISRLDFCRSLEKQAYRLGADV